MFLSTIYHNIHYVRRIQCVQSSTINTKHLGDHNNNNNNNDDDKWYTILIIYDIIYKNGQLFLF